MAIYGEIYECDHPVYNKCTLFKMEGKGLAVIRQRYDRNTKNTWWSKIDPWLTDSLYLHKTFRIFFDKRADYPDDSLYPTVTLRQIMWAMKMKPIKRERWETCFDRRAI